MAPGTLLRIYIGLQHAGYLRPQVGMVNDIVTVQAAETIAFYTPDEATILAEQAQTWHYRQDIRDILW